jgi:low affinity Fe/Cu permease
METVAEQEQPLPAPTRMTRAVGQVTGWLGSFPAILGSVALIVVWALSGPVFGFSDTWQLVINTGTTIVTFNMVFVIQNTQNRDGRAMQAKLDAQSQALAEVLAALDVTGEKRVELKRLVGVEEAPEQAIKDEQQRVHAQVDL